MERIRYIDVAKGILILMVVMHHVPQVGYKLGLDWEKYFEYYHTFVMPFFMPAFFVITGYCSKFNKPFKQFLLGNAKTIILPAFMLGAIQNWISLASELCTDPIEYMKLGFRTLLLYGGPYWFLSALFLSKMLYWLINHICKENRIYTASLLLVSLVLGVWLHGRYANYNYWYIDHALVLAPFLFIGKILHRKEFDLKYISLLLYVVIVFAYLALNYHYPYVTFGLSVTIPQIPLYLLAATAGTLGIIWLCKKIDHCSLLERFGENSLIIYCLHIPILFSIMRIYKNIPYTIYPPLTIAVVFLLCVFICLAISKLLNLKYMRFILGKF